MTLMVVQPSESLKIQTMNALILYLYIIIIKREREITFKLSVIFVRLLNIFPGVYLLSRIFSHFFSMFL